MKRSRELPDPSDSHLESAGDHAAGRGDPGRSRPDAPLPGHLLPLAGEPTGQWALWRTFAVRGAGFPAADVLRLADAACAAAADRLSAAEAAAERLRQTALEVLRGELPSVGKSRLDPRVKAIRRLERRQPAAAAGLGRSAAAALAAWEEAAARAAAETTVYEAAFAAAEDRLEQELRGVATSPRFREAVVWQNRHAVETGLEPFLRRREGAAGASARRRGQVQMIASYLQRYCTKNDSIGFFGPVGWGRLGEGREAIAVQPGEDLLASRQVYFEEWAIDAIAQRLAADVAMRPWLAPRRSPYLRREGDGYLTPNGARIELGPLSGALIAACDGTRSARVLLRELGPALTPDQEATLWGLLADFHAKGLIRWSFQIPLSMTAERTLRDLLLEVEEEPLREGALALLDEVVRARDEVARARGDAEALGRALAELEATFTRATGRLATRGDGQLYAGRTLIHEDCRRDLDVELGAPFLAEIAPALGLVLDSARWITQLVARSHRERFEATYAQLSRDRGTPQVDLLSFARAAVPLLLNRETRQMLEREMQDRWERVLQIPEGARRIVRKSAELGPRVAEEFAASSAGWVKARYHSPDLLIAAPSVEAIRRGDYEVVLGELHVAINTLDRAVLFSQHPEPERLRAAIESDLPEPCVIPVLPKWGQEEAVAGLGLPIWAANGRLDLALRSPKDFYLDLSLDPPGFPPSQVLPVGELVVEAADGGLVVATREGGARFDVIDFFQFVLMAQVIRAFRVSPPGSHTPRVTIDRLVVSRESWSFATGGLGCAQEPTAPRRFAAVRRWAAEHELPRFLFAKPQNEGKPFYVDLESPVLVEVLAKAVRGAAKADPRTPIHLSEMLPGHDQLWLPDSQGNLYTAELRMVALDLARPGEPGVRTTKSEG